MIDMTGWVDEAVYLVVCGAVWWVAFHGKLLVTRKTFLLKVEERDWWREATRQQEREIMALTDTLDDLHSRMVVGQRFVSTIAPHLKAGREIPLRALASDHTLPWAPPPPLVRQRYTPTGEPIPASCVHEQTEDVVLSTGDVVARICLDPDCSAQIDTGWAESILTDPSSKV